MAGEDQTMISVLRARLKDRGGLLLAVLGVVAVFIAAGGLPLAFGALGFGVVVAVAALLPLDGEETRVEGLGATGTPSGEANLQLFVDALPDPCIVLDRRSVLVHRNRAAAQQLPGLVPGSPIAMILRAPAVLAAIETVRRSGGAQTFELHQTVPTETWHRATVAPLVAGDGAGTLVVTMHSLTDEKRLEALRTDFIANASHELRTPLTSLLGFIETLMGPASRDTAAQARFLEIMRTHALRMSKLIDDLLSLSRIEMRQHLRPTTSVELASLLREVEEGLQTQASDAGVAVTLDLPPGPVTVTGDRDELYEVFENLVDNALKYGAGGGKVEIALVPAKRQGYDWLVSVADFGEGIETAHVPRLTERFYRVDAESSRKKKGTGLGLAIVKHIVTRHRGLLSIRSKIGQGTRVEVLLPGR